MWPRWNQRKCVTRIFPHIFGTRPTRNSAVPWIAHNDIPPYLQKELPYGRFDHTTIDPIPPQLSDRATNRVAPSFEKRRADWQNATMLRFYTYTTKRPPNKKTWPQYGLTRHRFVHGKSRYQYRVERKLLAWIHNKDRRDTMVQGCRFDA